MLLINNDKQNSVILLKNDNFKKILLERHNFLFNNTINRASDNLLKNQMTISFSLWFSTNIEFFYERESQLTL